MSGWKNDLEFRFQTAVCAWSPLRGKKQDEQDHRAPTENVPLSRKEHNSHLPEEGGVCVYRTEGCSGKNKLDLCPRVE